MEKRQKDIVTMAMQAGLSPLRYERKSNRGVLTCAAENGAERVFSISLGARTDARGDLNELGAMKRFARENRQPAPATTPTPANPNKEHEPMAKAPAPTHPATEQLSPVVFYRVAEWLKSQKLANFPTLEALALQAAQQVATPVSEEDMRLVLTTIGIQEPAHWSEPTDPQAIIVRELANVMKKLGEAPTSAFERLAAHLLP